MIIKSGEREQGYNVWKRSEVGMLYKPLEAE